MKALWIGWLFLLTGFTAQTNEYETTTFNSEAKLFIITLDGMRWQEVFQGADSLLLHDSKFTTNIRETKSAFWASTVQERRKKLLPRKSK